MPAPPEACSACGAAVEPGQEFCLECGSRVVPARRFSAIGRAWERKWGRYPGDWMWVALVLGLVAAGSATAGIVAARDTGTTGSATKTLIATSPVVPAPPTPPEPTTTARTTTRPATTPKPTPKPPGNALTAWPNHDGYTIVLASIPARGTGLAEATAKAKDALAKGSRVVGVLASGKFASLHPGYYVVFAGIYDSLDAAQVAARALSGRYPNAYARQISR